VGFANALIPNSQLTTTTTTNYSLGIGYSKKPFLKQLRALLAPADSRKAIGLQETFWEDFFWNAITMDASYSYGRQLQVKNGQPTNSYNTQPFYSVSGTYTVDLEKLWIYAKNITLPEAQSVRPADQGWYFGPHKDDYYQKTDERWGQVDSHDYSWSD